MIKNKLCGLFLSLSLLLTPTASFGCADFDLVCLADESWKWLNGAYNNATDALDAAAKKGYHAIKDLPDKIKKLVNKELKKLKKKATKKLNDTLQHKDVKSDMPTKHHTNNDISGRFSNIKVDVTNHAKIVSIGAVGVNFRVGIEKYKWAHLDVSLTLGDNSQSNWINSVNTSSKPDYDVTLQSEISGKIILVGGGTKISSIVEGKYHDR